MKKNSGVKLRPEIYQILKCMTKCFKKGRKEGREEGEEGGNNLNSDITDVLWNF